MKCNNNEVLPKVVVGENVTDKSYVDYLIKMMNVNDEEEVNRALAVIFAKLGLKEDDVVTISNVSSSAYDAVRAELQINGLDAVKALFHRRYGRDSFGLALTDSKKDHYMYKCNISKNDLDKIDVSMMLKGYDIEQGNEAVVCRRGFNGVSYSTFSATSPGGRIEQQLTLNVKCNDEDIALNREKGEYFTPKNERTLIAYLRNRSYPIKLDEVFKVVEELSFEGDLSKYPEFELYVVTGRKHSHGEDREKTDIISLHNGKLEKFGLMHPGELHDCSIKNNGAAVEFIGIGSMRYYNLVPRGGINDLGVYDIDTDDSNISADVVCEVGEKLVRLFPDDAEKMFNGKLNRNNRETDQLSLFDDSVKQKSKSDDLNG